MSIVFSHDQLVIMCRQHREKVDSILILISTAMIAGLSEPDVAANTIPDRQQPQYNWKNIGGPIAVPDKRYAA